MNSWEVTFSSETQQMTRSTRTLQSPGKAVPWRQLCAIILVAFTACPRGVDAGSPIAPVVNSVSPSKGGLAGGTLLTIRGENLMPRIARSAESNDDDPMAEKVYVLLGGYVEGRGIVCDLVHYLSSSTKIVCETPAVAPKLNGIKAYTKRWNNPCGYMSHKVQVFVDGVGGFINSKWNTGHCSGHADRCGFMQTWTTSTLIEEVYPRRVGPGAEVMIKGESGISANARLIMTSRYSFLSCWRSRNLLAAHVQIVRANSICLVFTTPTSHAALSEFQVVFAFVMSIC